MGLRLRSFASGVSQLPPDQVRQPGQAIGEA